MLDNARGEGRAGTCHSDGDGLCRTAYTPTHGTRRNGPHPSRTSLRLKGTSTKKPKPSASGGAVGKPEPSASGGGISDPPVPPPVPPPNSAAAAADESLMSCLPCGVSSKGSPEQQARARQQATI